MKKDFLKRILKKSTLDGFLLYLGAVVLALLAVFAIGNNIMRGVRVKSHEILTEIAESDIGFELETQFFSKLIRHFIRIPRRERMHGEWVLVFKKPQ